LLLPELSGDFGPVFLPAVITDQVAQGDHRVDVLGRPAHAGPFQAGINDHFVPTLDRTGANGQALRLKGGILHVGFAFLEIGQVLRNQVYVRVVGLALL
jgi:hypothetical protein